MSTFKEFERIAWEQKAERYNQTWGKVTNQICEFVLKIAKIKNNDSILDLGCGLGNLSYLATQKGAQITGADYSENMVKLAKKDYPALHFVKEDAEKLSFEEGSFDTVILNYLLLHLDEPQKALKEAYRVLKKNGTLIYTLWCPPSESSGFKLIFEAISKFADMSVVPAAKDPFAFSNLKFSKQILEEIGFTNIASQRYETFWQVNSSNEFYSAIQAGTRIGGIVDLQKPDKKEKIRECLENNLEEFNLDGVYKIPTPSIVVYCTKN